MAEPDYEELAAALQAQGLLCPYCLRGDWYVVPGHSSEVSYAMCESCGYEEAFDDDD